MDRSTREIVLDILLDIEKNHTFSDHALHTALRANQFMNKQDRAFITRMTEGVTEWRIRLDYMIDRFSNKKIRQCRPVIRAVLRMGCYEIIYMDAIPAAVTCNEYVKLTEMRGFGQLKGFVNAVLRNICRNRDSIRYPIQKEDPVSYFSVQYSVAPEVVRLLLSDYEPERVNTILNACISDRETCIRVHTDRISVEKLVKLLEEDKITVRRGGYHTTSLYISDYDYIRRVPGFSEGYFTVQDESSSLAVVAADIKPGELVLDVCAAPGGKTLYAASLAGATGTVIARDISEEKVQLIEENLERLAITNVTTQVYDALCTDENLIDKADCVIADLPCSGLGIMGRKNDIKYNITKEKVLLLADLQRKILHTVSKYVKPGGRLLFSTCTIDSIENEKNVEWFLKHSDFVLESMEPCLPAALKERGKKGYLTLVQGEDACDGFFIARLVRKH